MYAKSEYIKQARVNICLADMLKPTYHVEKNNVLLDITRSVC